MASRARAVFITVAHGVVGWALCGATMGIGMVVTTLDWALVIHAVAAPLIFAAVTLVYFRFFGFWQPLKAATAFLSVVVSLDLFVVALFIERSFEMFRSALGTWLPFLLIFLSSWLIGTTVRRRN